LPMVRGVKPSEICFITVGTSELAGRKGTIVVVTQSHRRRTLKNLARETHVDQLRRSVELIENATRHRRTSRLNVRESATTTPDGGHSTMTLLLVLAGLCGLSVGACFGAVLMAIFVVPKFEPSRARGREFT
jgi:hypothetical protein